MRNRSRGKGEGSIYKRADGYWVAAVEAGRDTHGKRRKLRVVRARKADAVEALDELRRQAHLGVVPNRTRTVGTYLEWWLTDVIAGTVTDGTLHEYSTRVKRITPVIGRIRLDRLTGADVQRLARHLTQTYPRSPRTRAHTLATLRQALRWAVGADLIVRSPAEYVTGSQTAATVKVDDTLEADEAKRVLAAAEGDRELGAFWWLALKYGLRIGELMALRWRDIDFANDEVTVRRAATKTDAGHRTLPLIPEARRVLQQHWRRPQAVVSIDDYVFARPDGQPLYHQLVHNRWNDLLREAEITHLCRNCGSDDRCSSSVRRFHVSRHTAATMLLEAGVELEVVSAILGHSNIGITASVYAKVRSDLKRQGLQRLS